MGGYLLVFRPIALVIIAAWSRSLLVTLRKPNSWQPPVIARASEQPGRVPISGRILLWAAARDHYRVVCGVGVAAGIGLVACSLVLSA